MTYGMVQGFVGNSDMPEAMGIANWECSTLTYHFSIDLFF